MKRILLISTLFIYTLSFAQENPAELATKLTAGEQTELSKVTAIFRWITDNISYKVKARKKVIIGPASYRNFNLKDDDGPLRPVNELVSETVLRKREAVCDGFARLFTTLCDYSGIRSEVIVGYARVGANKPGKRFAVNHYWNAVQIDGKWHLLDATWASGYLSITGDEFIRSYDPNYFLTPPDKFIDDHYPDDARWTLLDDSEVPAEFRHSPFRQKSFTKYGIQSFSPSNGIIETFVGDTVRLQLHTTGVDARNICPDLLVDSAIYSHSSSWVFLQPDRVIHPNKFNYTLSVTSPQIEWLYLMYNDDMVLRYKVNVKKRKVE